MVSETRPDFATGLNIAENASELEVGGKGDTTEMGRCREKNDARLMSRFFQ
jgi:hypothetical protein